MFQFALYLPPLIPLLSRKKAPDPGQGRSDYQSFLRHSFVVRECSERAAVPESVGLCSVEAFTKELGESNDLSKSSMIERGAAGSRRLRRGTALDLPELPSSAVTLGRVRAPHRRRCSARRPGASHRRLQPLAGFILGNRYGHLCRLQSFYLPPHIDRFLARGTGAWFPLLLLLGRQPVPMPPVRHDVVVKAMMQMISRCLRTDARLSTTESVRGR
jgi:hypothetical protein